MSRAFTKDEAPEDAIVVPPRAPLPAGVPNYVTPRGDRLLREEKATLEAERSRLGAATDLEATERMRQIAAVTERLSLLQQRLARTQVVDPARPSTETVRFGAHVVLTSGDGSERRFQIVGVDEAEPEANRVAFTSPIARAVTGKRVGDVAELTTASGTEQLVIHAIRYGEAA